MPNLALGFHDGNPEFSLHDHFARRRPEVLHCRRCVSLTNVRNVSYHVIVCSKGFEPLANRAYNEFGVDAPAVTPTRLKEEKDSAFRSSAVST